MTQYYTHYWAKSKNTEWTQCEFTEVQAENSPYIAFIEGKGYSEVSAQKLVDYWNAMGRRMGEIGYEYRLTPPVGYV